MLWMVRLALWSIPLPMLLAHLDARRVRLGSRLVPRCTCLVQALVAEQLLTELGYECVVRLGAAKTASGELSAHAWVECEGKVLVGGDVSGFAAFRRADSTATP